MAGKWMIHGDLRVLTGLHIGGSSGFSAIGAVDSPVVRDKRTGWPIVPGSSLKGKLRALLARSLEARGRAPAGWRRSRRSCCGCLAPPGRSAPPGSRSRTPFSKTRRPFPPGWTSPR